MSTSLPCLFRADANPQVGIGHVMRCLALARAWQGEGGRPIFLSCCKAESLCQRIAAEGIEQIALTEVHPDPKDLKSVLQAWRAISRSPSASQEAASDIISSGWCVVDGYHFDPTYQLAIRAAGCRLLVIDDTAHWPKYHADILLNQNITADQLTYARNSDATVLLGTRYVLLQPEFLAWRRRKREISEVAHRVLVTMGGGDTNNVSLQVIQALRQARAADLEIKVVVGPANPHLRTLHEDVRSMGIPVELLTNVAGMSEVMAWADVAVAAGGSTCWELAFMGVPSIIVVLAENQRAISTELERLGAAICLGDAKRIYQPRLSQTFLRLATSCSARAAMASIGQSLVDGWGVDRVVMRMCGEKLRLRTACEEDTRIIWEWANDPVARSVSFSPDPIPWEQHVQWFIAKLNEVGCVYYVALNENETPVGQIRFDVEGKSAIISVSLDPQFRGMGYGRKLIELAARKLFRTKEVELIHAYVRRDNAASLGVFSRAGFHQDEVIQIQGQGAAHFILPRDSSI